MHSYYLCDVNFVLFAGTKNKNSMNKNSRDKPAFVFSITKLQCLLGRSTRSCLRCLLYSFCLLPAIDELDDVLAKDRKVELRMLAVYIINDGRRGNVASFFSSSLTSVALKSSTALRPASSAAFFKASGCSEIVFSRSLTLSSSFSFSSFAFFRFSCSCFFSDSKELFSSS